MSILNNLFSYFHTSEEGRSFPVKIKIEDYFIPSVDKIIRLFHADIEITFLHRMEIVLYLLAGGQLHEDNAHKLIAFIIDSNVDYF